MYDIYRKALFDLIRTYAFKGWKLTIKHLMVGLLNLGGDAALIADQDFYDEALKPSRKHVKRGSGGFKVTEQWPPFWTEIFKKRDDDSDESRCPHPDDVKAYLAKREELVTFPDAAPHPVIKHLQMTCVKKFGLTRMTDTVFMCSYILPFS